MRTSRYIGGNKGTEGPSNLIFVDTETHAHKSKDRLPITTHSLRLWTAIRVRLERGTITRRSVASGCSPDEFWKFVDRVSDGSRRTWVFAHNIGFDLTVLRFWRELDEGRFTLQPLLKAARDGSKSQNRSWSGKLVIDHTVTFIVCRAGHKTYTFVDTCNYWPTKLWKVGDAHGLPKLPMPDPAASDDDWRAYCFRDVEIIEAAVISLIRSWVADGCGVFKTTAASLAFANWRHTCDIRTPDGRSPDVICSPDADWHELERASYFGGRIQPFYVGKLVGPIYHMDVNSLYPFVMRNNLFPRRFSHYGHDETPEIIRRAEAGYGIVASVLVKSRHDTYPLRVGDKQYHCNGQYWATLAGPELSRALRSGHVLRIGQSQCYSVAPLFRGWVDFWYRRKLRAQSGPHANAGEYEFCKLVLNSLSGKFAQHGRWWTDIPGAIAQERWGAWGGGPPPDVARRNIGPVPTTAGTIHGDADTKLRYSYRGIAGNVQVLLDDAEPNHAFPLISSYITAYAREYMRAIIESLPERSVYYMATDSLLLSESGYRALVRGGHVHQNRLGAFKLVGTHTSGEILGSNYYELDGEVTVAGWQAKAYNGLGGVPVCDLWDRLPAIIAQGPEAAVKVRTVPVGSYRPDPKGQITAEGWWRPCRLSPDPDFTDKPRPRGYSLEDVARLATDSWK